MEGSRPKQLHELNSKCKISKSLKAIVPDHYYITKAVYMMLIKVVINELI